MNFYIGNSAGADGVSSVPVGLRWERMVARVPQDVLEDPVAASRWWTDAAWQEIKAAPAAALGGLAKKAAAFFNDREFRNNICYHFLQQVSPPLRYNPLHLAVVFPLAIWGLIRLWHGRTRQQRRAFFICILWIAGYWAAAVVYFVTARYRLPAVPFLILPAAWGCVDLTRAIGRREYKSLLVCAAIVLAGGALCWPPWFGSPQDAWTQDYVNLGNSLSEAGNLHGDGTPTDGPWNVMQTTRTPIICSAEWPRNMIPAPPLTSFEPRRKSCQARLTFSWPWVKFI